MLPLVCPWPLPLRIDTEHHEPGVVAQAIGEH